MNRFEENELKINSLDEYINKLSEMSNILSDDSIRNISLETIVVILADISKSLAVIADALDKEENKDGES